MESEDHEMQSRDSFSVTIYNLAIASIQPDSNEVKEQSSARINLLSFH